MVLLFEEFSKRGVELGDELGVVSNLDKVLHEAWFEYVRQFDNWAFDERDECDDLEKFVEKKLKRKLTDQERASDEWLKAERRGEDLAEAASVVVSTNSNSSLITHIRAQKKFNELKRMGLEIDENEDPTRGAKLGGDLGVVSTVPEEYNETAYNLGMYLYAYYEAGGDRHLTLEYSKNQLKEKLEKLLPKVVIEYWDDFLMYYMRQCDREYSKKTSTPSPEPESKYRATLEIGSITSEFAESMKKHGLVKESEDSTIKKAAEEEDMSVDLKESHGQQRIYLMDSDGNSVITEDLDKFASLLEKQGIETRYDIDDDGIEILVVKK